MKGVFQVVFWAFMVFTSAANAFAAEPGSERSIGWVKIDGERALYVDFEKPAPGKPVIVLVHGLTYTTKSWEPFARQLRGEGYGILRFDPMGMGQTLVRYGPALRPFYFMDQIKDMRRLFMKLNLRQPIHLVGLSYGGGLATLYAAHWPEHVASVISMAPHIAPVEKQDNWIRLQIATTRMMFPLNPATDDQLYDYFLRGMIYTTYPYAEPVVLEHPYKLEAIFRLVQGIRKYQATEYVDHLPPGKFHLLIARKDQYIDNRSHDEHWNSVPAAARGSRVYIEESEHKIVEDVPKFSAALVKLIVAGNPVFSKGHTVVAVPSQGIVRNGQRVLIKDLPKE